MKNYKIGRNYAILFKVFQGSRMVWNGGKEMEGINLYSTLYYQKSVFKGSYRGMNFHIQKGGGEDNPVLTATAWKGPYILEKTTEEIVTRDFAFSEEGIASADKWLMEQQKILCL